MKLYDTVRDVDARHLTKDVVASVSGVTKRFESGTQALSVAMSHLLRLLANDPSRLRELIGPTTVKTSGRTRARKKTLEASTPR